MLNHIKRLIPNKLKTRIKQAMGVADMETRLKNIRRAGFVCSGAIDVGAFSGEWAKLAADIFGCHVVLVEPQPGQQSVLRKLAQSRGFAVEPVALGKELGELQFVVEGTNSRIASDDSGVCIRVPVDRLDQLISRHSQIRPNLLKVDVQGYELSVLDGAGKDLELFEVIILEVSIIRIGPVPVFREVVEYMNAKNYRLYDLLPMYHRPLDGALWQADAFFVRNDSHLVARLDWN